MEQVIDEIQRKVLLKRQLIAALKQGPAKEKMDTDLLIPKEEQESGVDQLMMFQDVKISKNEGNPNQESLCSLSLQGGQSSGETSGKFQCHKCPETFNDIVSIKCHWHDAHGLKHPSQCKICDIPFPDTQQANQHKKEVHGLNCPECGKGFKKPKGLEHHMEDVHGSVMEYPCKVCGLVANKKEMLIRHMKSHETEGTEKFVFHCTVCQKPFIDEEELREHENIHDKPMTCEFCNEVLPRKSALQAHKRDAHPEEHLDLKRKAAEERNMKGERNFGNKRRRRHNRH